MPSPLGAGRVRLSCEVLCDAAGVAPETYWLDMPPSHAQDLTQSANPWLALMLPFAVHLGEPLRIDGEVDGELLTNAHELMRVWESWYPRLRPVSIEADVRSAPPAPGGGLTASLFSGGVDAWFTLLSNNGDFRHRGARHIDELIFVWGLDIPLDRPGEFRSLLETLKQATSGFDTPLVDVATNLRNTAWWRMADWGATGHGCALASVALALERRYRRLLVPSTHSYVALVPWGSHPLTDPLPSTSATSIVHDGAGYTRVAKTAVVAKSPAAINALQVCWATGCFSNCGKCAKCYRTMATLDLLGELERCPRFPAGAFQPSRLAFVCHADQSGEGFMREVQELAVAKGRQDIVRYIERSAFNGWWIGRLLRLTQWMSAVPVLGRIGRALEWRLRALVIA